MYSFKILLSQPKRLLLTITGISLCIVLILFLLSVYRGVADGSVEYIRKNKTDLWILQANSTNILRGTSLLSESLSERIKNEPGVKSVASVLLLLTTIKKNEEFATIFLAGFDPAKKIGGPPEILNGRNVFADNEIVLDKSFSLKYDYNVGDYVYIRNDSLKVVGLSGGTNALVIQYAFVTLKYAQSLVVFPGLVTCFLIDLENGSSSKTTEKSLSEKLPGIVVYSHATFLKNNIKEMESGFLPILYAVAVIGVVVLTTILSLILSISILEKKKDFAIIKILGSPGGFLPGLVIKQSLLITFTSCLLAIIVFFPLVSLIEFISPEVSSKTSLLQILSVLLISGSMGLISAFISINRLRKIYALEAFRQ